MAKAIICIFTACFIISLTVMDLLWGKAIGEKRVKKKSNSSNQLVHKAFNYGELERSFYIKYALIGCMTIFFVCLIFVRSMGLSIVASLAGLAYPYVKHSKNIEKRRKVMDIQLREAMYSISNSLKSGNSLQTAIENCCDDLKITLMSYKEKPILEEMQMIVYEQQLGKSLDEALLSFRDRVKMEDVDTFVMAAIITKQKGGNLTEVMKNVSTSITEKMEIKREIMILTAAKRSEAKLLSFAPFIFVLVLSVVSPSYMKPMYDNSLGKGLMLIGMILLVINYFLGKKIVDIDV